MLKTKAVLVMTRQMTEQEIQRLFQVSAAEIQRYNSDDTYTRKKTRQAYIKNLHMMFEVGRKLKKEKRIKGSVADAVGVILGISGRQARKIHSITQSGVQWLIDAVLDMELSIEKASYIVGFEKDAQDALKEHFLERHEITWDAIAPYRKNHEGLKDSQKQKPVEVEENASVETNKSFAVEAKNSKSSLEGPYSKSRSEAKWMEFLSAEKLQDGMKASLALQEYAFLEEKGENRNLKWNRYLEEKKSGNLFSSMHALWNFAEEKKTFSDLWNNLSAAMESNDISLATSLLWKYVRMKEESEVLDDSAYEGSEAVWKKFREAEASNDFPLSNELLWQYVRAVEEELREG